MSDYIEVDGLRVGPCMWRNLKEELTAAREEAERLRGLAADLVGAFDQTLTDTLTFDDYETLKRVVEPFRDAVSNPKTSAWLLRKQAEAVEAATTSCQIKSSTDESKCYSAALREFAKLIRQQADSLENGE